MGLGGRAGRVGHLGTRRCSLPPDPCFFTDLPAHPIQLIVPAGAMKPTCCSSH